MMKMCSVKHICYGVRCWRDGIILDERGLRRHIKFIWRRGFLKDLDCLVARPVRKSKMPS